MTSESRQDVCQRSLGELLPPVRKHRVFLAVYSGRIPDHPKFHWAIWIKPKNSQETGALYQLLEENVGDNVGDNVAEAGDCRFDFQDKAHQDGMLGLFLVGKLPRSISLRQVAEILSRLPIPKKGPYSCRKWIWNALDTLRQHGAVKPMHLNLMSFAEEWAIFWNRESNILYAVSHPGVAMERWSLGAPATPPLKMRKKRVPKACESCRQSKVRCDGQRPCSRKIEALESEINTLRAKLHTQNEEQGQQKQALSLGTIGTGTAHLTGSETSATPLSIPPPTNIYPQPSIVGVRDSVNLEHARSIQSEDSPSFGLGSGPAAFKRKRSHFVVEPVASPDFVTMGLITPEEAESYFTTFFQGCDQYVPVFDPRHDTLEGIRGRSGLLFSTICAVGCRVLSGTDSHKWHLLNFHIKRVLNSVIGTPEKASLETVQALLVRACYVSERSLFVTAATKLAIDLGLPNAYEELSTRFVARSSRVSKARADEGQDDALLMRKARTWLHLLVLGHILHVDASDLLTFKFRGDVRRCRVLLESPHSTDLDLHLFSQVELNVLRANTYATMSNSSSLSADDEMMDIIRDAKIDIDLWYNDWMHILGRSHAQKDRLEMNLRIQRCWADTMALCRVVRLSGVENVDAMSPTQRSILLMAKDALTDHLAIIIKEPREYLHNLRFAMDFVWAKCAFCFLLLLKLSVLLGEDDEKTTTELVGHGKTLLAELHLAGGTADGGRSSTSRLYIQLLQMGIEKYSRARFSDGGTSQTELSMTGTSTPRQQTGINTAWTGAVPSNDLESFVPEQFVFEWDFPGLTLFSSPTTEAGWLDDFLRGALIGSEEFYHLSWNPVDTGKSLE